MPHTGTQIPADTEAALCSPWLGRKDTDWWIERLYEFASELGATSIRTSISRTVIDVNRDPAGVSLYPGQATTELCPTTTFDGEPLYRDHRAPDPEQVALRRATYFEPYHQAIVAELSRLRAQHPVVVLYDCHSIRSQIPRLFAGTLPNFNIGTHDGASCAPALAGAVESACDRTAFTRVTNGRFTGGYTIRHHGHPSRGIHAIQMELACRGYMREPEQPPSAGNWPSPYDPLTAGPLQTVLKLVLQSCLRFATS
jgi:formiminoglutamase